MLATMTKDDTFGKLLRRLRVEAGMTQDDLASRLGVTGASISHWESDKHPPGYPAVKSLVEVFGNTELFDRAGFPDAEYESIADHLRRQDETIAELKRTLADLERRLND